MSIRTHLLFFIQPYPFTRHCLSSVRPNPLKLHDAFCEALCSSVMTHSFELAAPSSFFFAAVFLRSHNAAPRQSSRTRSRPRRGRQVGAHAGFSQAKDPVAATGGPCAAVHPAAGKPNALHRLSPSSSAHAEDIFAGNLTNLRGDQLKG